MNKCSNKPPDYNLLDFKENSFRKTIYDLVSTSKPFSKFIYFRLETPKQPYLINQGAKYVCESWINGSKILHTGLIPTGAPGYFVGDFAETIKDKKKTSLIIFRLVPETDIIQLFFFNQFNKKSIRMKMDFARSFIRSLLVM